MMPHFINPGDAGVVKLTLKREKISIIFVIVAVPYSEHFDIKRLIIPECSFHQLNNGRSVV